MILQEMSCYYTVRKEKQRPAKYCKSYVHFANGKLCGFISHKLLQPHCFERETADFYQLKISL